MTLAAVKADKTSSVDKTGCLEMALVVVRLLAMAAQIFY
jgi:hypothetical protein